MKTILDCGAKLKIIRVPALDSIKHYTMETYRGMEIQDHAFITSVASRPDRYITGKTAPVSVSASRRKPQQ
jgi:hypothetical protein